MTAQTEPTNLYELQGSFEAFSRISDDLSKAYDQLRKQAVGLDLALAESNRRLEEKVQELDEVSSHLHAVLGALTPGVLVSDQDGRITYTNRSFEEMVGIDRDALRGMEKTQLCDADGRNVCESSTEEPSPPRVLLCAEGRRTIVRSSVAPVRGPAGEIIGEVETLSDETEVERLRQELRCRETLSALGEMAAGIAHEIRNPLSAVEGFAHLLLRKVESRPADCIGHARRIVQGVRQINTIISNLLCFAQPNRFHPCRTPLEPLYRTLDEAYRDTRPQVRARLPKPIWIRADPALLERMFINLIDNARTAVGPDGTVEVTASEAADGIELVVRDDGPGIPDDLKDRLFLPFVTGRPDGTGLGLAIVHRIVDLHGGRVTVESSPDEGTQFRIHLPRHEEARAHYAACSSGNLEIAQEAL